MGLIDNTAEIISSIKKHFDALVDQGQILKYKPDQFLFYEGHRPLGAYLLVKGTVQFCKADDPSFKKEIDADSQPIIGMDYLVSGHPYDYSAKLLTAAELCYLPKSEILKLLPKKLSQQVTH